MYCVFWANASAVQAGENGKRGADFDADFPEHVFVPFIALIAFFPVEPPLGRIDDRNGVCAMAWFAASLGAFTTTWGRGNRRSCRFRDLSCIFECELPRFFRRENITVQKRISSWHTFTLAFLFTLSFGEAQNLIIPQIADGGGWQTTLVLTNTSPSPATANLTFFQETGGSNTQPWSLTFLESSSPQSVALPAAGTLFLHSPGTAGTTSVGWAQLAANSSVNGYAIFTKRVPGRQNQDGTVEAAASSSRVLIPFDNTNGFVTSVALANTATAGETLTFGFAARLTKGDTKRGLRLMSVIGGARAPLPRWGNSASLFLALCDWRDDIPVLDGLYRQASSRILERRATLFPNRERDELKSYEGLQLVVTLLHAL